MTVFIVVFLLVLAADRWPWVGWVAAFLAVFKLGYWVGRIIEVKYPDEIKWWTKL